MGGMTGAISQESINQQVTRVINDAAQLSARRLYRHANNEEKLDAITLDVCKFTINHAIGMPTQKSVIAGEVVFKVVYDTTPIDTSSREAIKSEACPIPQLSSPMPVESKTQAQVMSVDQLKQVGQSLGDAVHE